MIKSEVLLLYLVNYIFFKRIVLLTYHCLCDMHILFLQEAQQIPLNKSHIMMIWCLAGGLLLLATAVPAPSVPGNGITIHTLFWFIMFIFSH